MLERLAINQITTPAWSLEQAVAGYARHGVHGIGVWRDKLAECGVGRARRLLRGAGAWVPSLCKAGDLAQWREAGPRAAWDDCRRAIDEAAEIGAGAIVFVCGGGAAAGLERARAGVLELLCEAAPLAARAGVRLGIEPFHPMHAAERGCVNTLAQALRLCEEAGAGCGVVVDVFHTWWDPDLHASLDSRHLPHVATVQLCDWRVPTRHPVNDRAMMGDGAADLPGLVRRLERNRYRGPYEVEIFSTDWWACAPDEVVRIAVDRCRKLWTASTA